VSIRSQLFPGAVPVYLNSGNPRLPSHANAVKGSDLKVLIDDYGTRGKTLSREGRALAYKVRMAGNDVLHQQDTELLNALEVIEAARSVILELIGATLGNANKIQGHLTRQ
jgi:hypothetical protein